MPSYTNNTELRVGFLVRVREGWLTRRTEDPLLGDDLWAEEPKLYFVKELHSVGDKQFATLVPVPPGERHRKLPYLVSHILDRCEVVHEVPTSAGDIKENQAYQVVTSRNVFHIEKLLDHGVRVSSVPPSDYGSEVIPWEQFCQRVYQEPQSY